MVKKRHGAVLKAPCRFFGLVTESFEGLFRRPNGSVDVLSGVG
jgi:hypothetical protein